MRKQLLDGVSPSRLKQLISADLRGGGDRVISTVEWGQLEEEGDAWLSAHTSDELADMVRRWRVQQEHIRPLGQGHLFTSDAVRSYVEAMSALLHAELTRVDSVLGFRIAVLSGRLITPTEVPAWIRSHSRSGTGRPNYLEFPDKGCTHRVAVWPRTDLDRLRSLAGSLARRSGWQPAQAVVFVLTDATPLLPVLTVREHHGTGPRRVTLEVDAEMPPEMVAAAFLSARRRMLGGKRVRSLTPRNARLVAFVAERHDLPLAHPVGVVESGTSRRSSRDAPGLPPDSQACREPTGVEASRSLPQRPFHRLGRLGLRWLHQVPVYVRGDADRGSNPTSR